MIDTDFSKTIEITIFERMLGNVEDKIAEENIGTTGIMTIIEVGTDQEKGHSQEIMVIIGIKVQAIVDQDQDPETSTNRDRIRCYNCQEYDHFTRDCPTSREERELE